MFKNKEKIAELKEINRQLSFLSLLVRKNEEGNRELSEVVHQLRVFNQRQETTNRFLFSILDEIKKGGKK